MTENNKNSNSVINILLIVGIFFAVIIGSVFFLKGVTYLSKDIKGLNPLDLHEIQRLALLGDYFSGTVGLCFALAGIFAVVIAYRGQKEQIRIQNDEIKIQKDFISVQENEIFDQQKNRRIERFENNFYHLLNIFSQTAKDVAIKNIQGKECFKYLVKGYYNEGDVFNIGTNDNIAEIYKSLDNAAEFKVAHLDKFSAHYKVLTDYQKILYRFNELYDEYIIRTSQHQLGPYYRALYHLLKLVFNQRDLETHEKKYYSSLVRSQLSSFEIISLFYNGILRIAEYKNPKKEKTFSDLLEYFSFFEHLEVDKALIRMQKIDFEKEEIKNFYRLTFFYNDLAFGNNFESIKKNRESYIGKQEIISLNEELKNFKLQIGNINPYNF